MHLDVPNVQAVQEGNVQAVHQEACPYLLEVGKAYRQVASQRRLVEGRERVACPWAGLRACLVVGRVAYSGAYDQDLEACLAVGMAAFRLVAYLVLSQDQIDALKWIREATYVLLGP
jgi:hypothetical protein